MVRRMVGTIARTLLSAISLLVVGCSSAAPPAPSVPIAADRSSTGGSPSAGRNQQGRADRSLAAQAIEIGPGLVPDPAVFEGVIGGPIDASTLSPECRGLITTEPTFAFRVMAPMPLLRVLVAASADATLVVQREDGSLLCNDDTEGFNPVVQDAFTAGLVRVWVGAYSSESMGVRFSLGLSERMSTTTANMTGVPDAVTEAVPLPG